MFTLSLFVVASTFVLILAGGLVTSHEAGLAVPDWPLSYGQWFPPMVGNIFWEHGHRMIAGIVGILTVILAVIVQIYEQRQWLKNLVWCAVGMVLLQALLGGLTVLYMLPASVSIAHACLAQTFFSVTIAIAYFLKTAVPAESRGVPTSARLRRLLILTTAFIYIQLILGAVVRHTQSGVTWHVLLGFLVLIHILLVGLRIQREAIPEKSLVLSAQIWGGLTVVQMFLGLGSFVMTRMMQRGYDPSLTEVLFTAAHQTLGALILGIGVLFCLRLWR